MANKKIKICIIDDNLPYRDFNLPIDENSLIDAKAIEPIAAKESLWQSEPYLRQLFLLIINSDYYKSNDISLTWALHPSQCIKAIEQNRYSPDLVIFDWEYFSPTSINISELDKDKASLEIADELKILLSYLPEAFFFVYSNVAPRIPIYLFKKELDKQAKHFQVLPKGGRNLILSSEELIYDYILLCISDSPMLNIGNEKILFNKSKHLQEYKDILHLEFILGKESLKKELAEKKEISEKTVRAMLEDFPFELSMSSDKSLLIADESDFLKNKYGPLSKISYSDVFEKYGLQTLSDILNNGLIKVSF